ncbi:hypothetical protein [uncultured Planktomarina sp.]|uniref:hypothetical protein n=1 Tax=uncultured Planktomarina sp. TaxID=1538529 RepID=UPI003261B580
MSDNVTQFPGKTDGAEELCIICECGCRTMYVLTSGWIECSACGNRLEDDLTAYKAEDITEVPKPDNIQNRHALPTEDFAFHQTLSKASLPETVALAVMNADGVSYTWSIGAEGPDQIAWLQERVDGLMASFTS